MWAIPCGQLIRAFKRGNHSVGAITVGLATVGLATVGLATVDCPLTKLNIFIDEESASNPVRFKLFVSKQIRCKFSSLFSVFWKSIKKKINSIPGQNGDIRRHSQVVITLIDFFSGYGMAIVHPDAVTEMKWIIFIDRSWNEFTEATIQPF